MADETEGTQDAAAGTALAPQGDGNGGVQGPPRFLAEYGVVVTDTDIVLPPDLPFDKYLEIVRLLGRITRAQPWYVGGALAHGERVYGEMYAQAMNDFGLAYQTLANYHSVYTRVEDDVRRAELSFGHHAAVSMLDKQQQAYWLEQAVEKDWSRSQLREAIVAATRTGKGTGKDEHDPGAEPPPEQQQGAAQGEGAQPPQQAVTGQVVPEVEQVMHVARDVYDSAVPVTMILAEPRGYYAVPHEAMQELAEILGEEWVPDEEAAEPEGGPEAQVVEHAGNGGATLPATDDDVSLAPPAAPPPDPPQEVQHTRTGAPVLDPSQVVIGRGGPPPNAPPPAQQDPATATPLEPPGEVFDGD